VAAPMPDAPPVTIAILSLNLILHLPNSYQPPQFSWTHIPEPSPFSKMSNMGDRGQDQMAYGKEILFFLYSNH
jgi:hypothetical protein